MDDKRGFSRPPLRVLALATSLVSLALASPALAEGSFTFSTGLPDGRMAMASQPGSGPGSGGNQETEAADDFVLPSDTSLTSASFTGLLPGGVSFLAVSQVRVEIYRVFPTDSNTAPTPTVPTRANSPADDEFASRDTGTGDSPKAPSC